MGEPLRPVPRYFFFAGAVTANDKDGLVRANDDLGRTGDLRIYSEDGLAIDVLAVASHLGRLMTIVPGDPVRVPEQPAGGDAGRADCDDRTATGAAKPGASPPRGRGGQGLRRREPDGPDRGERGRWCLHARQRAQRHDRQGRRGRTVHAGGPPAATHRAGDIRAADGPVPAGPPAGRCESPPRFLQCPRPATDPLPAGHPQPGRPGDTDRARRGSCGCTSRSGS